MCLAFERVQNVFRDFVFGHLRQGFGASVCPEQRDVIGHAEPFVVEILDFLVKTPYLRDLRQVGIQFVGKDPDWAAKAVSLLRGTPRVSPTVGIYRQLPSSASQVSEAPPTPRAEAPRRGPPRSR